MNNKINELVKNMIDENVVDFKENATKILYEKTGKQIEAMYQTIAKNLLTPQNNETNN